MSWVTAVMVTASIMDDDKLEHLSAFREMNEISEAFGGTKHPQVPVYAAGFNYLDIRKFIEHVRSISWERPDRVQIFIKDEEDDVFTVHTLTSDLSAYATNE